MRQFPASPITALIDESPHAHLSDIIRPHLSLLGVPDGQVLLASGAAAALFLVALLHSDGEIVAGLPCYPPMLDALRGLGARVTTVSARFEDGYRVDLEAFRDRLSARTRLVMIA